IVRTAHGPSGLVRTAARIACALPLKFSKTLTARPLAFTATWGSPCFSTEAPSRCRGSQTGAAVAAPVLRVPPTVAAVATLVATVGSRLVERLNADNRDARRQSARLASAPARQRGARPPVHLQRPPPARGVDQLELRFDPAGSRGERGVLPLEASGLEQALAEQREPAVD